MKAGDEHAGFEASLDPANRILRMEFWGVWKLLLAKQSLTTVLKIAQQLEGGPWGILANSVRFPAQAQEITELRQEAMRNARLLGCTNIAAVVGNSAAYNMQFRRISNESALGSATFQDERAALKWLLESLYGTGRSKAQAERDPSTVATPMGAPGPGHGGPKDASS